MMANERSSHLPEEGHEDLSNGYPMRRSPQSVTLGKPHCQVNCVYSDDTIPSWRVLGNKFIESVAKTFAFESAPRDMEKKLKALEEMQVLIEEYESAANQLTRMQFNNGLYIKETAEGNKKAFRIEDLSISPRQIYVNMQGDTNTALEICRRVAEEIGRSAGIAIGDLESEKQYVDFSTASKVDLGVPLTTCLGAGFKSFLSDDIASGDCFGRHFVPKEIIADASEVRVKPSVYSVKTHVRIIDLATHTSYREILTIYAESAQDESKGILIVQSKLPTSEHLRMCDALVARVKANNK